ncbi:hypothetical protein E4U57_001222 [Claviceps arundinis]|uniref:Vacuolar protein sorting-associated protein 9a n=1 Tax=Claviceps arundinis TaxID=1623583 RepID=A0ABQ7PF05_9HYPO|nr:hypothetical protein E4U57_001222 [Claviceps arundinis]
MKPIISAMHAWSCTVISVFAIVILSVLAVLYRSGHEELVGGINDPSPEQGKAVAGTIFTAVLVYASPAPTAFCAHPIHHPEFASSADLDDRIGPPRDRCKNQTSGLEKTPCMSSSEQPHGREVIDQPGVEHAPCKPDVDAAQPAEATAQPGDESIQFRVDEKHVDPVHDSTAPTIADIAPKPGAETHMTQESIAPGSKPEPEPELPPQHEFQPDPIPELDTEPEKDSSPSGNSAENHEHAHPDSSFLNTKDIPELDAQDGMASSAATIKPIAGQSGTGSDDHTQYLSAEHAPYVDPTPATPMNSQSPSRSTSTTARSNRSNDASPSRTNTDDDEDKRCTSEDEQDGGSKSEIQSIMEQFSEEGGGPGAEEVMSPRLELASPTFGGSSQLPPRRSSLAPRSQSISTHLQDLSSLGITTTSVATRKPSLATDGAVAVDDQGPPVPPKDGAFGTPPRKRDERRPSSIKNTPASPQLSLHRPPPPEPEPEPSLPFDFHRFLEQLRNKKADPVARYLKSFLSEFGKKQWMVHEQVKIISDFLAFIANKMMICEVWGNVSDAEFDNAREGMEKLVMNRLYAQTFSPAIAPPRPIPGAEAKSRRRGANMPSLAGPGRRGQHQEDVERDEILAQKINIYGWVKLEHLDIPAVGDSGRRFLKLAQQELLKIKSYRAPRDKIICVLNCSKVIFGLLKHNKADSSADSFMPLLIYVVLQCNPEHLVSNVQYILRFRDQEKLGGEAGYYLSSLMGAIQFIENMDRSSLTIPDEEFEANVEAAVSVIAEKHQATSPPLPQIPFNEKAPASHTGGSSGRPSIDNPEGASAPRHSTSSYEGDAPDGAAAMSGLLRTFQKPLSTIGRIFSDDNSLPTVGSGSGSGGRSSRASRGRRSPQAYYQSQPPSGHLPPAQQQQQQMFQQQQQQIQQQEALTRHALPAEEAAARQASAEAAEAQRLQRAEHVNVVETLSGMFPDLDKDIISDVVYQKQGRVGLAVDACLALSS